MKYIYNPKGVCSTKFEFEIENNIITSCKITNGCPGNTKAVATLILNRQIDEVISLLKGIPCRGNTSCPDQIATALIKFKNEQTNN